MDKGSKVLVILSIFVIAGTVLVMKSFSSLNRFKQENECTDRGGVYVARKCLDTQEIILSK